MLVNLSNHPSSGWNAEQTSKAEELYGSICDYPFPAVPPEYVSKDVILMAERIVGDVMGIKKETDAKGAERFGVMCQGEYTLTYALVGRLKREGIEVISAVSDRVVKEERVGEEVRKTLIFRFAGFREYSD